MTAKECVVEEVRGRYFQAMGTGDLEGATRLDVFARAIESMSDTEFALCDQDPIPGSLLESSLSPSIVPAY